MRRWARWLRIALLGLVLRPAGAAELLLDPWRTPDLVARLAADPAPLKQFRRVHVFAFSSGQVAGPSTPAPFGSLSGPAAGSATKLVSACRAVGVPCCWVFDALRWERKDLPGAGLRATLPDWFELNSCLQPSSKAEPAGYASPFDPRVGEALTMLMSEAAGWDPQPDGLTLVCRLSPNELLGFGQASRRAMILASEVDPLDITSAADTRAWYSAREQTMTALLKHLIAAYRARRPDMPCHALTTAIHINQVPSLMMWTADNGAQWAADRLVDGLYVDGDWSLPPLSWATWKDYGAASKHLALSDPRRAFADRAHAVVGTRNAQGQLRLLDQIDNLAKQGCGYDQMAFQPTFDGDLALVLAVLDEAAAAQAKP